MKQLDPSTLEAIADLICGDDGPYYRTGSMLPIFFRNAGLRCPLHDGSTRKWWTLDRLREYNADPQKMEKVIKRLADPKEYKGDFEITNEVIKRLNKILSIEGLRVELDKVTPIVHEIEPTLQKEEIFSQDEIPDFSKIINDDQLYKILIIRWEETFRCIKSGAYLSAIIMMGSILEGILLSVISSHPQEANQSNSAPKDSRGKVKSFGDWTLSEMINVAHEIKWIKGDVKNFSHSLRDYRNLVHPWYQKLKEEYPDKDTCKICLQVTIAAINDLIETFGSRG